MNEEKIAKIIDQEVEAILEIDEYMDYSDAVNEILATDRAVGKVITTGMGKAGHIAHSFATTLCSIGIPSVYLDPMQALHGDLGLINVNDNMVIFSNSGETEEILKLITLIRKRFIIPTILITSNIDGPLGKLSDCVLGYPKVEEVCPLGLTPTTSTTVMSVICDILVVLLIEKKKLTKDEYAFYHHGGYLGKKAKN